MSITLLEGLEVVAIIAIATATIGPLFCWVLLRDRSKPV